jgi:2-iminobutanoate/2-iminopropanoate deaminase
MLRKFNPKGMSAHPAYSHGVEASGVQRLLFISGQVGIGADGASAQGMKAQTAIAVSNLKTVLADAGMGLDDIAKLNIYLTDESLVGEFMEAGKDALSVPPPAITLLYVKALASPALLVEIEAIAAR